MPLGLNLLLFAKAHQSPACQLNHFWHPNGRCSTKDPPIHAEDTCRVDALRRQRPHLFQACLPDAITASASFKRPVAFPSSAGSPQIPASDLGVSKGFVVSSQGFNNWVISLPDGAQTGRGFGSESDWVPVVAEGVHHLVKTCAAAESGAHRLIYFGSSCPSSGSALRTTIGLPLFQVDNRTRA